MCLCYDRAFDHEAEAAQFLSAVPLFERPKADIWFQSMLLHHRIDDWWGSALRPVRQIRLKEG